MVEERLTDGKRIAQLLASELEGHGDALAAVSVVDADPDVTPSEAGAFAYAVAADGDRVAEVYVHPDRARVEFTTAPDVAADTADAAGLRVRPKAVQPPRTLVFLADGTAPKRILSTFEAVRRAHEESGDVETGR